MKCEWDDTFACPWRTYEVLDTFYFYEGGQTAQRYTLEDSAGNSMHFSQSLSLLYTHSGTTSNSGDNYDGSTSLLTYRGPGQLRGLPVFCIDPDTNIEASECVPSGGDTSTNNANDIRIDPTVVLSDIDGNEYYAKYETVYETYPVRGDETHALCADLTLPDGSFTLPELVDVYTEPSHMKDADGNLVSFPTDADLINDFLNGGDPAVIGGVTMRELELAVEAEE